MATQRPISTISYNSEAFLKEKLDTWYKAHIIQAYLYICHKGEDGDKDHIHLRIEPNKRLDPMDLIEELKEYPQGCTKPLGVRPFRNSNEEDWLLYAVHDKDYLNSKYSSDSREKLPYSIDDIRTSPDYDIEVAFIRAKSSLEHTPSNMVSQIEKGVKATDLIAKGSNPFLVNACVKSVYDDKYSKLVQYTTKCEEEIYAYQKQIDDMCKAVCDAGHSFEIDSNGHMFLL